MHRPETEEHFFRSDGVARQVRLALTANAEFFAALAAFMLLAFLASQAWNFQLGFALYSQPFLALGVSSVVLSLLWWAVPIVVREKPKHPFQYLWNNKLRSNWAISTRLFIGLPVALALPIFFSLFTSVKISITSIVPFYADPLLANADRTLMGADAWRLLQPLVGLPPVTFILSFSYGLWFVITMMALFWMTFMVEDLRLRRQYLVAFILAWAILGNALAVVFSSVGPCFYQAFYGSPRYANLMAYLHAANQALPIWSLPTQKYLLSSMNGIHPGAGISAFPSMHIAEAMLNVMLCRHFRRVWLVASAAFLVLIFVASISLGWHYAVDGFASLAAVPALWWVAGKFSLAPLFERAVWRKKAAVRDVPVTAMEAPVVPE